jgi:ribose 5-phosphate isomerase RpiB
MARAHNNANFIAFGGRNTYSTAVTDIITTFMGTEFEGGRHQIRVSKIASLEEGEA